MELTDILIWLLWIDVALWLLSTIVGIVDHMLYPPLGPSTPGLFELEEDENTLWSSQPLVTVLIPARNEEHNIARCLKSVETQKHHHLEVIVIDDRSEDKTAQIVRSFAERDERFHLLSGGELPAGWIGKGWALFQGHKKAKGSWIILLDADTELLPEAVSTVLRYAADNEIDFLNPTPQFVNRGFWEKAMQPVLWGLVMTRFPMMWVNSRIFKENMAFGPFILVRRRVYDAVEGHKFVCHDILEDVALARMVKGQGYHTRIVNGKYLFKIRMYENFSGLLEGWIKTAFGAMNYNLALMVVAIIGLFGVALLPILALLFALGQWALQPEFVPALLLPSLAAVGALYVRRIWDMFRFRFGFVSLGMHAVSMLVVQYMQMTAVWRYYFGSLTWKGRAYKPREERKKRLQG